jgi:uncharacterized membrane protein
MPAPRPVLTVVLRSAVLGLASGSRSTVGVAALAWPAPRWVRAGALLATAAELTGDKLPKTPSRLDLPPLTARLAAGATCGAVVARRAGRGALVAGGSAVVGAAAAYAGARAGAAARAARPGIVTAVVEDSVALAGATVAARGSSRR